MRNVASSHDRRRVVHFNVTSNPTAEWTARQITEAFPEDSAPRYMIRDRDGVYGDVFRGRVKAMGIKEVLIAPRSPWQNPFVERAIGTLRRECLDHIIVVDERHLRRVSPALLRRLPRPKNGRARQTAADRAATAPLIAARKRE